MKITSIETFICLSLILSVNRLICLCIYLCLYAFIRLSVSLFVYLSICSYICISIQPSVCLSVYLSIILFAFICFSVSLFQLPTHQSQLVESPSGRRSLSSTWVAWLTNREAQTETSQRESARQEQLSSCSKTTGHLKESA